MKKQLLKEISAIALSAALTCTLLPAAAQPASAASKVQLTATTQNLTVGQTHKLKLVNGTGWKITKASSNKTVIIKIAKTTNKQVKVKAKSVGTATVRVTVQKAAAKKNLKCKFTVEGAASLDTLTRNTAYGQVKGTAQEDVQVFYGVPYGADTGGENRWKAPEKPSPWKGVKDCTKPAEMAMQMASSFDADGNSTVTMKGTTDCLNLDIYTKADAKNLPVFIFLHGGNNQTGSSMDLVGNDLVVRDDCIVVSINHRLGLMGFNCLPALQKEENSTGNYGLLDIAFALQWVRDNIGNFGGDAGNVTVTGFSAGGRNVMALLVSPVFKGLFDKAISFSGGMTISNEDAAAKQIASIMAPMAVEDGRCATEEEAGKWLLEDSDEVKEYLYSISSERLVSAVGDAGIRMSAFPHLFGDGVTLPKEGFTNAEYCNDVPVIMLTGTSEFSMFCNWDPYIYSLGEEADAARAFSVKYGSDFYRIFNTQLSAEAMDENYKSNIYTCQINYGGESSKSTIPSLGSFHGIFLPMISSLTEYGDSFEKAEGYQAMSGLFNQYLKNFMQTGNPNGNGLETKWKPWTSAEKATLVFDADEETKTATAVVENVFKTNAEIIAEMDADNTLSAETKAGVISKILNGRWFSSDLDAHYENANLWKD